MSLSRSYAVTSHHWQDVISCCFARVKSKHGNGQRLGSSFHLSSEHHWSIEIRNANHKAYSFDVIVTSWWHHICLDQWESSYWRPSPSCGSPLTIVSSSSLSITRLHHSSVHHTPSSPSMTELDRPTREGVYGWCLASSLVPWHYSTLPVRSGEFLGSCFSALRRLVGEKGQQITSLTRGSCCLIEITAESCKSDFVRWPQYHTTPSFSSASSSLVVC